MHALTFVRGDRPVVHRAIRHVEATLRELSSLGCRLTSQQVPLEAEVHQLPSDRCHPSNSLTELGLQTGAAGFEPAISRLTAGRFAS